MRIKKDKILAIMSRNDGTQTEIGRKIGVSRQLIGAWINGDRNPKLSNVQKIATALNCSVSDIAEVENEIEEMALRGDKFSQSFEEQPDTDYIKGRINEIYNSLDRALRAELLAAAERIAAENQPKTDPAETKIEAEKVLNCPTCGKEIPVPDGAETLFCCHCGQKVRIKD